MGRDSNVKRCGTCKWAAIPKDAIGRNKPKAGGNCLWPEPARTLPVSNTDSNYYRPTFDRKWIWADSGTNCPCWERKATNGA